MRLIWLAAMIALAPGSIDAQSSQRSSASGASRALHEAQASPPQRQRERTRRSARTESPREFSRDRRASRVVLPLPPAVPTPDVAADVGVRGAARDLCIAELRAAGHHVEKASPAPAPLSACAIPDAIQLHAIAPTPSGVRIALPDKPILSCGFARVVADFSQQIVAPLALAHLGAMPASIATGPGYECRGRNRIAGAKISAHGQGGAVDIAGMRLSDGRALSVEKPAGDAERRLWSALRKAACGWFTTVLGPGSDAQHANHLHLDAERHGSSDRYRLCQ